MDKIENTRSRGVSDALIDGVSALIDRKRTLDKIGRGISNPMRTPQGFNRRIIAKVRSIYNRRHKHPVSLNFVEECWDSYRTEFPKRLSAEDSEV